VDTPVGPVPALLPPALACGWPAVTGRVPALGADTEAIRAQVSSPSCRVTPGPLTPQRISVE